MNQNKLLYSVVVLYGLAVLFGVGSLVAKSDIFKGKSISGKSGSVAILHIYGPIQTRMKSSAWAKDDADALAKKLHSWSEDDDIKVIILRINSPGGTVGAVQEIYREVVRCKAKGKLIIASLGDVAASGGYYLAASADKIVANPGTITGSIGVILQFGNLEGLFQKVGVRLQVVKSGEHKDIGSPARALTPEERRMLQASIDDAYAQFVDAVMKGRSLPKEKVLPLADGRIFTGREAQAAGLVDELGNREDALDLAIKLAGLKPKPRIISDGSKSLRSLFRDVASSNKFISLESLGLPASGFSLEYSLR